MSALNRIEYLSPNRLRQTFLGAIMAHPEAPLAGRKPGRPPVHEEAWTKVTVVLFNRQIVFLDRLAANIRAQSGAAISRAQLIRALLDAVADANIDLTTARTEAELKAAILARLEGLDPRKPTQG
ncbi:MAG: hypothetical protein HOQ29_09705 [Acidobacteria bacterium]|nr:hypothetical protein [Acidobacteriota bacterium]